MQVEIAVTDAQVEACYPVMRELRPHLDARTFVRAVRDMQSEGYALAFVTTSARVVAVAGYRIKRTLFCDRFLYVDDLATISTDRSKGYGAFLLEWLKDRARAEGCAALHLGSATYRKDAHRFYERNGLQTAALHFQTALDPREPWSGLRDDR